MFQKTLSIFILGVLLVSCNSNSDPAGAVATPSSTGAEPVACTDPETHVVDYGTRRTAGAAINVRGAYSDIRLIPNTGTLYGTNFPAMAYNETNTTAGVTSIKYMFWDGSDYKLETVVGGLTATFIELVYLSDGKPLLFWGNGATALFMAVRNTADLTTAGRWTVSTIDTSSTAIRAVAASVSPNDQVLVSFTANTTTSAVKASVCLDDCHLAINYTPMLSQIDAAAGTAMNSIGTGWCRHTNGYYPMVLYGDAATSVLSMCRNSSLENCRNGANWTSNVALTGSGANALNQQLYIDSSTVDATVYMAVKTATGIRPYTYATCATGVAATSADPGADRIVSGATIGNIWFKMAFGGGRFHVVTNDAQIAVRYTNQTEANYTSTLWTTTSAPHVETTGALGIAAVGVTRGGLVVDPLADQVLLTYGRTAVVTSTQTFGNIVLAYNDCPAGTGTCGTTTLDSPADSTTMIWGNVPVDTTGQIQRNITQSQNIAVAATSSGRPATAYIDYSVGISAEPVTGALLKYAYRNGETADSPWVIYTIPTTSAPQGPGLAFDHNNRPWVSWYETAIGTGGFRYYLATNSQTDGSGLWTVHAYPLSDAAAPTLPAVNMTAVAMSYSNSVASPVMVILRNPVANKGVHAARFNITTGQWEKQGQIINLAGTTTPGGAFLSVDYNQSGLIAVAVHDLGTGVGATCTPTTARCARVNFSTDGGATWGAAGQIFSGDTEGLNLKLNPSNNRPAISFFTRASDVVRYRYCTTDVATCNVDTNWGSVDSGYLDLLAGVNALVDNGVAANSGLLSTGLTFSSSGAPTVVWPRGSTSLSGANLMHSSLSASSFEIPGVLRYNGYGNIMTPIAANAGNFALSWNPASVRTSTGALHTVYNAPGNFLAVTSCGN